MRTSQDMVTEFHFALGHPVALKPGVTPDDRRLLRLRLIAEEVAELMTAICGLGEQEDAIVAQFMEMAENMWSVRREPDIEGIADGCCDVHVVVSGTAIEFGIPEDKVYKVVHEANMAKVGGAKREDGKTLRPEGWVHPDVKSVLRQEGWKD